MCRYSSNANQSTKPGNKRTSLDDNIEQIEIQYAKHVSRSCFVLPSYLSTESRKSNIMSMLSRKLLLLLIILISELGYPLHFVSADLHNIHRGRQQQLLERTLKSLNKVVDFYGREFRKFNIDGIFGLQALDGEL